jgi:histone acetyltransferase (RNA polymerase elongator complex component)
LGLGLGKKVLNNLLEIAKDWKLSFIKLDSTITARGFYKKHGFVDNGPMRKVLIGGYPVTCYPMKRILT